MANTFHRFPRPGGDLGVGAIYNEEQLNGVLGTLTGRLYNSGGVLYVPLCRIGIDDGSYKGIADIDTVTTVSLAGCSNSTWLKIEMSVSGTSVTFAAADIAGATDPTVIPATVRAAWNGRKGGYYLEATKRLVALAWLNSSGVLLAVVNFRDDEWWASQIGLHTGTINEQDFPQSGFSINLGNWDMDATASISVTPGFGVFGEAIGKVDGLIIPDDDSPLADLKYPLDREFGGTIDGCVAYVRNSNGEINFYRTGGGQFDNNSFDKTPFNRGVGKVYMRDF